MIDSAALFYPAIRWDAERGFESQHDAIEAALDAGVGGFILFGGPAEHVTALTARLHSRSKKKLLIGADLERGAGQQFAGATALPPLAAIGSLDSITDIRRAGSVTAREARSLGVNWIYAPDCDLDIEPDNPIIGTRSFGSDPEKVAAYAAAWIEACQMEKALACAKHFPGHGRTTTDSHAELPRVTAPLAELERTDFVPFRAAVAANVASVMSAHVSFPALDGSGAPATLSSRILRDLLRDNFGFRGLVVTDALIMEGVLGGGESEAVVRALEAGCDCLLYPNDLAASIAAVSRAIENGRLDEERIEGSLQRRDHWASRASLDATASPAGDHDDSLWARQLAERVVHPLGSAIPHLRSPLRVIVVDDDVGGPYPAPSRAPFVETLLEGGAKVVTDDTDPTKGPGTTIIALYGDIRAWKGRPGFSSGAITKVRELVSACAANGVVLLLFSHPRLAPALGVKAPTLCAWGGEAVMQRAAARVLLRLTRS
jgi:beta-glucosidase-like glycosyl hydrolase